MEIILKQLIIRNFKGVLGELVVDFSPTVTKIYGRNRKGKTTIADAFRWCLFGKNTEGKADFGIKCKDKDGNVIPELEHSVTAVLMVDGNETAITRTYTEKWTKPRGVAQKVLTGHTTTYTINGQLYTQRDFTDYINSLCSESLFMAITSPTYFVGLKADQQRSILTEMVGEVSPASVAKGKREFEALLQIMGEQDIEKFRQHLSYQMKEIKAELERIPVRISEQQNDIASLTPAEPVDWAKVEGDIKATEAAFKRIAEAIAETIADHSKAQEAELAKQQAARKQVREQIAKQQDELERMRMAHQQAYNEANIKARQLANEQQRAYEAASTALTNAENSLARNNSTVQNVQAQLQQLAAEKEAFKARWVELDESSIVFDPDQFICPTCKRQLEAEDVDALKAKLEANFNADKARKLDSMEREAQQLKQRETQLNSQLVQAQQAVSQLEQDMPKLKEAKAAVSGFRDYLSGVQSVESRLAEDKAYQQLKNETIPSLQAQLDSMPLQAGENNTQEAVQSLQADQQQLQEKLNKLNALQQVGQTITKKQKRINELEQQEQQLNIQLTQLEGQDFAAEQLLQFTIEELETKVNALFSFVTFTMFDHRINGALKPMCECTVAGVPYSDLNNADRINAGLDIINAICRHRGIYAPCFIDNAESINEVLPMHSQRIDLIVSTDNELQVIPE
ncbi:MAG: AAA family ATPase [Bacteroidales bacterium]|nr:AAA family ATPase [Bacteroidales bacterium]